MRHEIVLAPQAIEDLRGLDARDRATVKEMIERNLRHEPTRVSRGRIKRLRGIHRPGFRLRVGDIRVFYDVTDGKVEVLAIVPKERANVWLSNWGETE
ncbi:MAG: type II toxin-antitoxin system RelE family toxin [Gammaproteobacteria bacterium]